MPVPRIRLAVLVLAFLVAPTFVNAETPQVYDVGVARVDITPKYAVRLSGFGFRRAESEGVNIRIYARALAIGKDDPAVLLTVDNLGVSTSLVNELAKRLTKHGVHRDRLAVTATHTHTAPMLTGVCPTLFGVPIPEAHQKNIDRYTKEFLDNLEKVAIDALKNRKPAKLTWGVGKVGLAINRRMRGGPVDHDFPMLVVRDTEGKLRAMWTNYACHCVTLSHNKIGGDWAGYAAQAIEDDHPGAIALVSIGCGADSNPSSGVTGDKTAIASRQGLEIAKEVKRLLKGYLAPVTGKLTTASKSIELPLADLPTRAEWEKRANRKDAVGHHARVQLARLDRGEKLRTKIDYRIMTWSFGKSLGLVFLPGEVVVDYALRLKKELDNQRLWINAYSNDAPCYIPSERVLKEGGYEGGGAMVYYDVPVAFRPGLEQKIISTVHDLLGKDYLPRIKSDRTGGSLPQSPQQSLGSLQTKPGFAIDLVAAEPLTASPVAIDFGYDGRLWVAEMVDYPSGVKGDFKPGGRVSVLEDTNGDGIYDKSTIFLENIPFPTGITVWRKGVLVCAAPDILYAEDSNGDGKADYVKKLYSGFGTENYQARVNSLEVGLDGWLHGSCGLFGGRITSHLTGKVLNLGNRDFRIQPETGAIEPATGRTQQGRVRDDQGNWFGCDNSNLARHYVLPDHYLRRNPHVAFTGTESSIPDSPEANRLYPVRPLQLFKLSGVPGRVTAACGIGVYRDDLLGKEYTGNLFTCEPVNLAVHRLVLSPRGSTFAGSRARDEKESEFLASTDGWCRPVQMRTGPDGAIWVVDMYRFIIEHPRWIPKEDLAKFDARAGSGMGRIYRIHPGDKPLRLVPRIDRLSAAELVKAFNTPNGIQRDQIAQWMLWHRDLNVGAELTALAKGDKVEVKTPPDVVRLHALCVLDGLGKITPELLRIAMSDTSAGVRRHAVRLAEKAFETAPALGKDVVNLLGDKDAQVRLQVAFSLGEWKDPQAGRALAKLASNHADDSHLLTAVLSSVNETNIGETLAGVLAHKQPNAGLVEKLLATSVALGKKQTIAVVLRQVLNPVRAGDEARQYTILAGILDATERKKLTIADIAEGESRKKLEGLLTDARTRVSEEKTSVEIRTAGLLLLGRESEKHPQDIAILGKILVPQNPQQLQSSALITLARIPSKDVAQTILAAWKGFTPMLQTQALDVLLARDSWRDAILTSLEKKEIPSALVDAARRQRLLTHKVEKVRQRAAKIFSGAGDQDRQKVLTSYTAALKRKGDAAHGKAVFSKHCATCHKLEGVGHEVGPNLAAQANKTPLFLLTEILDPNRNLDSRYLQYLAITRRGLTITGLLGSETATSITLKLQEGKTQVLLRADLEELAATGKSLMPEGLEKDINLQDMADLLAYLGKQASPPKTYPGNKPTTIQETKGGYTLLATTAEIHGRDIVFEAPFRNIGYWHGEQDHIAWTVEVTRDTTLDVYLDFSCDAASAGNLFVLEGGKSPVRGAVQTTGGWDRYQQRLLGKISLTKGTQRLVIRPEGKTRGALMDLRGVYLVTVGEKPVFNSLKDPKKIDSKDAAKLMLDDTQPQPRRLALVTDFAPQSGEVIKAMVADLKPGTKEEYRRIPWIWRMAIAAGKQNDATTLKNVLDVSLPRGEEPLHDWQAVVIGGGVINGISQTGQWPAKRIAEIIADNAELQKRWKRSLELSSTMADNPKTPTGTRYDALRMIAMEGWAKRGEQLKKYLTKGTHNELTMGAISGLSDIDTEEVAPLLIEGMLHFSPGNRKLAAEALLRTTERVMKLLDAVEGGKLTVKDLTPEQVKALREHKEDKIRTRALKVFK